MQTHHGSKMDWRERVLTASAPLVPAPLLLTSCMVTPYDGQVVDSTGGKTVFDGYVTTANTNVQVQAWDFTARRFLNAGVPFVSSSTAVRRASYTGYEWSGFRILPTTAWERGPAGGSCAVVEAWSAQSTLTTVDASWATQCRSASDATIGTCSSSHVAKVSPEARLFTRDWGALTLGSADFAGAHVALTFDDFADINAVCSPTAPSQCPHDSEGYAPNTYAFYQPNGSKLRVGDRGYSFSLPAWRMPPLTGYMAMTSSTVVMDVDDGALVMVIALGPLTGLSEPEPGFVGPTAEIYENCINNAGCIGFGGDGIAAFDWFGPFAVCGSRSRPPTAASRTATRARRLAAPRRTRTCPPHWPQRRAG